MRGWRRAAEVVKAIGLCTGALVILTACATTEYKVWEAKANVVEGNGGTKVMVDGMELWDNGEPPRKFTILRRRRPHPAEQPVSDRRNLHDRQWHRVRVREYGDGSRVVGGGARAPQRGQVRGHQVPRLGRPRPARRGPRQDPRDSGSAWTTAL
jgi:hypothetical protein